MAPDPIDGRYEESERERRVVFEYDGQRVVLAQPTSGYAMVTVRAGEREVEQERYYGFDMAIDHAAELLGVDPSRLAVPEGASDLGM